MGRRSKLRNAQNKKSDRISAELCQALFDQATDGIFIADKTGKYQEVNQSGCDMLGYTREEILALSMQDVISPEELANDPLKLDELQAGKSILKERYLRCKDGRLLPVEISATMLANGSLLGMVRDISQRKQVQEQLRESNERFQLLAESSLTGIYFIQDNRFRYVNPAMAHIFGYEVDEIIDKLGPMDLVLADDRPLVAENIRRRIENEEEAIHYDFRGLHKDGSVIDVDVHGRRIDMGGKVGVIGSLLEITKRKQAEEEHQVHLWFLESLDKVNRAMQGINDLEQIMSNVLDTLLSIFNCDRAFLVYPCDPEAATWQAMMERTRPEYPGVLPIGAQLPLDATGVAIFQQLRAANGPVQFGPGASHALPPEVAEAFSVKSFIAMALYPKVGLPWSFGLHQCTYPRLWTHEEERLLQEIGRRLADSLTSLLSFRNLRQSERRLGEAERIAHVGWWNRSYVENRITLSDEACRIFGIPFEEGDQNLDDWHERWKQLIHPEDRARAAEVTKAALQGGPRYEVEYRVIQPGGKVRVIKSEGDVTWDEAGRPLRMFGIMQDITDLRQVEDELRRNREAALQFSTHLAALHDVTNQLSLAESSDDLCRLAVQLGRTNLGFDRVSMWFIDEVAGVMRGTFGTDETGELRDERNIEVPFRPEGLAWIVYTRKESAVHVEQLPLRNHLGEEVGQGENAMAALWDSDNVVGVISIDNLFKRQPITDHQLEVLRLYATTLGHLITRKRVEEERRASEDRFRTFVDHATDAFYLHDEKGIVLDVNHQACLSLGYSREELLGMSPYDFDAKFERSTLKDIHARLNVGEVFTLDTVHRRKDGQSFPVEVRVRPFWQGGRRYAVSLARDITERERARQAQEHLLAQIRDQAQQVQNIVDTVPEGVILLSKERFVTLTNPVARQFLQHLAPSWEISRLSALGSFPLDEFLTSPPKGLWHEITAGNLIFEAIARPVENSPHNGGWVLVFRDVTQERDIQNRVQRQDRLAAVGQLAAGIAHDFNNILTVIRLYTQLISRTAVVPRHVEERLNVIEQQTERATDLIQQILDFSRQSVLERQPLDLLPFMRRLVKLLERTLPENISIELNHVDDAYLIRADASRIQQMMMNLAVNARDAMPDGGLLNIILDQAQTAEPKALSVNDLPPGCWIMLAVADSGTGIRPEVASHMFEPFFTTKQIGMGTGLGLAQVYGIVEQHEGYIDVVTTVGQGTTFQLYFPALETAESPTGMPDKSLLKLGQGQTILLVEDNQATREALMGSLTLLNYEVMAVSNGREALTILATQQANIDLVLSDVVMPEMGGVALFHAIREQALPLPVVLLTGHSLSSEMENLQLLGLAGWMPKPPDLATLSHLLADVLAAPADNAG